jgi:hypothetical protein
MMAPEVGSTFRHTSTARLDAAERSMTIGHCAPSGRRIRCVGQRRIVVGGLNRAKTPEFAGRSDGVDIGRDRRF